MADFVPGFKEVIDQAKQLRDVDYALAHLAALGATVKFDPQRAQAVVTIRGCDRLVKRLAVNITDDNPNVAWITEIGNLAFEMHVDLVNDKYGGKLLQPDTGR